MTTKVFIGFLAAIFLSCYPKTTEAMNKEMAIAPQQPGEKSINIGYPSNHYDEVLDGRLVLLISSHNDLDLRFQLSDNVNSCQAFGMDVESWNPNTSQTFDLSSFGYPIQNFNDIPTGEYFIQVLFHKYEIFNRSDGHVVKLPMDRGEGQQ
ncbi:MAG: hypothetical protein ACI9P5_004285, partial [Saprospiraceae bacterium]